MSTLTIESLEFLLGSLGVETPFPSHASSAILDRPLDIPRAYLAKALQELVPDHAANAHSAIIAATSIDAGDLCVVLRRLDHTCDAEELAFDLMARTPLLVPPFPEGVQLRFFLEETTLPKWLPLYILDRNVNYGRHISRISQIDGATNNDQKRVLIEFSSPNVASENIGGEFLGKHLRSTLLGMQLCNIYTAAGWSVTKLNYLGDWGKPMALLGAGFEKFGSPHVLEAEPAVHLHEVRQAILEEFLPEKQKIRQVRDEQGEDAARGIEANGFHAARDAFFKRMEDGDASALAFANKIRDISIEDYMQLYDRLGVDFDEYSGESKMVSPEAVSEVMDILRSKDLIEESGGNLVIDLKKQGSRLGTAFIQNRDGSSTYLLRDLVAVLDRHRKYEFDTMIYLVAADSNRTHFQKLFKIIDLMGYTRLAEKMHHTSFSDNTHIAKDGDPEQTPSQFLDQVELAMEKLLDGDSGEAKSLRMLSTKQLCKAALFAQVASTRASAIMAFNPDKLASIEPGSGLDLLAWYQCLSAPTDAQIGIQGLQVEDSETKSAGKQSTEAEMQPAEEEEEPKDCQEKRFTMQKTEDARSTLLRLLARYPEVVDATLHSAEPNTMMTYLTNITTSLSSAVPNRSDLRPENDEQRQLFHAARVVLQNALGLLGISPRDGNRDSGVYV